MMMKQDAISSRVIALMNQKGGVGKTTTAVNLSAGLASVGVRTLVVDLDPQAHATLHLGIEPESLEKSVYEILLDPPGGFGDADRDDHVGMDPDEVIVQRSDCLDVLPAVTDLAAVETELASERVRHHRLKAALRVVGDRYDFIM
ncbi:MAG: AAA family ATPase, partial [Planctomycetota bacterium]